jgi:hypothetical protein
LNEVRLLFGQNIVPKQERIVRRDMGLEKPSQED